MTSPDAPLRYVNPAPRLLEWLRRASLSDLVLAGAHSQDFSGSRAEYIYMRVRLIALTFAAMAPLWIPLDYLFLEGGTFYQILLLRVGFSVGLLLLGLWSARPHSLSRARIRLLLLLFIPCCFYVGSRLALGGALPEEGIIAGYAFLPYVMVALLAVFPLTVVEGALYLLLIGGFVVGTEIYFQSLFTLRTFGYLWLLGLIAVIASWAELAQLHMLLRLYREATRDALTGLVNRRSLFKWLAVESGRARAQGRPLSVLLFDLDLFKRINDTYGHLTGDAVLRTFGEILRENLKGQDLVGRYGGEEFLAILPGHNLDKAKACAERIREACHQVRLQAVDGRTLSFTTSIGVAEYLPGEESEQLLSRVDEGLYQAKEAGRDRVVVAAPAPSSA